MTPPQTPRPFPAVLFGLAASALACVWQPALAAPAVPAPAGDDRTVLCFVSHQTSHGFGQHEYAAGCRLIGQWLAAQYPDRKIESRYSILWPEKPDEFFADADTVVIFCSGGGGHLVNPHVEAFDAVMKRGVGLACLHYAVEVPVGPSAKGMLSWMGGFFEAHWSVNPHWVAEFTTFTDHPAARGLKPFKIDDEWYFHMRFVGDLKGVTPILSAVAPEATMKRPDGPHSGNPAVRKAVAAGQPQHVAWTYQRGADYGNGRGFGFTGLHYHWNWEEDNFRKCVLNGVAWSAGLEIPADGIASARPTREALTANAVEFGGPQDKDKGKEKAKAPAPTANAPEAKPLFVSDLVTALTPGHSVDVDVALPAGTKELHLVVAKGGEFTADWADWAEARFVKADGSEIKLADLAWKSATSGWGQVQKNANVKGQPLRIAGKPVAHGIGTHSDSHIVYAVPDGATRFKSRAGIDNGGSDQNEGASSSVQFLVFNAAPAFLAPGAKAPDYLKAAGPAVTSDIHQAGRAVETLSVHPELEARLFASEPMLLSPSAIDVDHRGRIWVCDVVNYRKHAGTRPAGDRILILEDTDHDGKADRSTVFHQGTDVDSAHGICVLGDRVILSAGDDVFSLFDRDGDGKADPGSKKPMFTKIGGKQHDHGIHAFHFGPDGKLYFNFGNAGTQLCDPSGQIIKDLAGREVRGGNLPYQEGMVFRCDLDGSNVETLGWNFRNNWELAVDSFGTIWQSDNDDDGNQGVRINYVMEHGNYGYKDEITRAGWRDARPGMNEEIPLRHWHLNDPGVVPNLLQTGAGSPTGICVYEGTLLPEMFRGQPIHCDAGPNVVRAYVSKPHGAGYRAEIVNLLENTRDRWFRPSDVVTAPDGSLIVADWYDPGVGGHGMGDLERGRVFRVVPKGHADASPVTYRFDSIEGALEALKSPNESARYLAWQALSAAGREAVPALHSLFRNTQAPTWLRARALWLLAASADREGFPDLMTETLLGADPNLRITAIRAWRAFFGTTHRLNDDPDLVQGFLTPLAVALDRERHPAVLREMALTLRFLSGPAADQLWARLVERFDGEDRWYLEALGIGADLHWDTRLAALKSPPHDLLVWRSRAKNSATMIADLVVKQGAKDPRLIRAVHFQPDATARTAAYAKIFREGSAEPALSAAALLGTDGIAGIDGGRARLDALLEPLRGRPELAALVDKLGLPGFETELADVIAARPDAESAVTAARLLLRDPGATGRLAATADREGKAAPLIRAIGKVADRTAVSFLSGQLKRKDASSDFRREVVSALAGSLGGGQELVKLAEAKALPVEWHFLAATALSRSADSGLRAAATTKFQVPPAVGTEKFPPVAELMARPGHPERGKAAFAKATCITCHKVGDAGIEFGPDLSGIGQKLSREAMYEAILYPSAAISHGFQGVVLKTKDGSTFGGFITGETDSEVTLRLPGGVSQAVKKDRVAGREDMPVSLMPPGLAAILTEEELVDLVAWLETLRG